MRNHLLLHPFVRMMLLLNTLQQPSRTMMLHLVKIPLLMVLLTGLFFFFSIFFSAHLGTEFGVGEVPASCFSKCSFRFYSLQLALRVSPPFVFTCTPTYTPRFTHFRFYFAGLHYLSFCLSVGPTL